MQSTIKEIAQYLEEQAKIGEPITYAQVITRFPDLPPLTAHGLVIRCVKFSGNWTTRHLKARPSRTALVFAEETGRPGQGFFDTVSNLRNKTILRREQDKVWTNELKALIAFYA